MIVAAISNSLFSTKSIAFMVVICSRTTFSEENLLNKGLCPSGSERNLKTAAPLTTFSADIGYNHQLLLADAQTSGGLLMSVPKAQLATLLTDLKNNISVPCAVIGQVIQTNEPAQIQVES